MLEAQLVVLENAKFFSQSVFPLHPAHFQMPLHQNFRQLTLRRHQHPNPVENPLPLPLLPLKFPPSNLSHPFLPLNQRQISLQFQPRNQPFLLLFNLPKNPHMNLQWNHLQSDLLLFQQVCLLRSRQLETHPFVLYLVQLPPAF